MLLRLRAASHRHCGRRRRILHPCLASALPSPSRGTSPTSTLACASHHTPSPPTNNGTCVTSHLGRNTASDLWCSTQPYGQTADTHSSHSISLPPCLPLHVNKDGRLPLERVRIDPLAFGIQNSCQLPHWRLRPMSDEAEPPRRLKQWCKDYLVAGPSAELPRINHLLTEIQDDALDRELMEEQVTKAVEATSVSQRFCAPCRHLFSSFPRRYDWRLPVQWTDRVAKIEAGSRCGCLFCCLILTWVREADVLDVWYKIENRLTNGGVYPHARRICVAWARGARGVIVVSPPGRRGPTYCGTPSAVRLWTTDVLPSGTSRY